MLPLAGILGVQAALASNIAGSSTSSSADTVSSAECILPQPLVFSRTQASLLLCRNGVNTHMTHANQGAWLSTSFVCERGTSAPSQSPLMAICRNCDAGVLLYSRFQLSSAILEGGSESRGFLALGAGLGVSSSSSAAAEAAGAACGIVIDETHGD